MANPLDFSILGKKYGRLTSIRFICQKGKQTKLECICDCGVLTYPQPLMVKRGTTTSCGCFRKEFAMFNRTNHPPIHRKANGEAALNSFFKSYSDSAKRRNYSFDISKDMFRDITSLDCHYCGSKPQPQKTKGTFGSYIGNGIDRIDNSKGYAIDNCVPCCSICNRAKGTLTYSHYTKWIKQIVFFEKDEVPKSLVVS